MKKVKTRIMGLQKKSKKNTSYRAMVYHVNMSVHHLYPMRMRSHSFIIFNINEFDADIIRNENF
jgi:hypothetical protein